MVKAVRLGSAKGHVLLFFRGYYMYEEHIHRMRERRRRRKWQKKTVKREQEEQRESLESQKPATTQNGL